MDMEIEKERVNMLSEMIMQDIQNKALELNRVRKENKKNIELQNAQIPLDVYSNYKMRKSSALHSTVK